MTPWESSLRFTIRADKHTSYEAFEWPGTAHNPGCFANRAHWIVCRLYSSGTSLIPGRFSRPVGKVQDRPKLPMAEPKNGNSTEIKNEEPQVGLGRMQDARMS